MFDVFRVDIASPYYKPDFADHLTEVLSAPGMSEHILDDSKLLKPGAAFKRFMIKLPERLHLHGVTIVVNIDNKEFNLCVCGKTGISSRICDGYYIYDLAERKFIDMITNCYARAVYPYTEKSRIVLLDPDGDSVDCTFSKP